jgi:hypothetical protein
MWRVVDRRDNDAVTVTLQVVQTLGVVGRTKIRGRAWMHGNGSPRAACIGVEGCAALDADESQRDS